jgi:hypothetical protein
MRRGFPHSPFAHWNFFGGRPRPIS